MKKIVAHQRPDGRWEAKGVCPDTGRRKSYYSRLSAAEAERQALESYGVILDDRTLYGYYATAYLPTILGRSDNWKSQVGWAMDKYVLPVFGKMQLSDISRNDLQRFFNRLTPTVLSPSSAAKVKIVFSGVLNLAEADGYILRNPCSKVRLPTAQEPDKIALTFDELRALLDGADDRLRPLILLCGFAGLRIGEACAVTRKHLSAGVLQVRQQILQPKGGSIVSMTLKTPQSKGDIPLPAGMLELLSVEREPASIWIASNSDGGYMLPNNVARDLEATIKIVGIPRVTPHELRHTFISLLENELECPVAVSATLARKKAKGVTAGYSHTHMAQLRKWMEIYWGRAMSSKKLEIRISN